MILYIIKSILCSALFIGTYYLLLEKEKMHRFKRWYLLATLLLSLGIPLLTVEIGQTEFASQISNVSEYFVVDTPDSSEQSPIPPTTTEHTASDFNWSALILIGYGIITAVLLVRIFNNFLSILSDASNKTTKRYRKAFLVVHPKHVIPYSFLNYIFISPQDINNKQILLHELTHIRQKHTLDILLIELTQCLMWFNPAILFYKKAIRLNHEFLADEKVITNHSVSGYQQLLLIKSQTQFTPSLTSSFNFLATKKRLIMMTKSKNQTRAVAKALIASTLIGCAVVVFSEKVYAQNDSIPQVIEQPQVKTDLQDVAEFDTLIRKFTRFKKDKNGKEYKYFNITGITDGEKSRMLEIYKVMTAEQKAKYPEHVYMVFTPIPPPKKQSPTNEQMTAWTDPTVYGIWLDGKRISNAELAKYKSTDIAHVFMSRLMKNAAHYGRYKFHVALMTHPYFDKTYPPKSE